MQKFKVTCKGQDFSINLSRDFLGIQKIQLDEKVVEFPPYITLHDLQLYTNFIATGYSKYPPLTPLLKILIVADFLSQENICETLISHILGCLINYANCQEVLDHAQSLSMDKQKTILHGLVHEISEANSIPANEILKICRRLVKKYDETQMIESQLKDQIFSLMLNKSNCRSYAELLAKEMERIEQKKLVPEVEFVWKINLQHVENEVESDEFSLKSCRFKLEVDSEDELKVLLNCENQSSPILFRGLIIYQGVAEHFFYLSGTPAFLSKTSKKTSTSSFKIVLKSEGFLYDLLVKAACELENTRIPPGSYKPTKLILSFLQPAINDETAVEIISKYCELCQENPDQIMELFDWSSKDCNFCVLMSQKFPILKKAEAFKEFIESIKASKSIQQESVVNSTTGEAIYIDENPCPPLSPSGNPFILDISDIQTAPTSENKGFLQRRYKSFASDVKFNSREASLGDCETICKCSRLFQKYHSPSKYFNHSGEHKALDLIKDLRRKLDSERVHHNRFNAMMYVYPLLKRDLRS